MDEPEGVFPRQAVGDAVFDWPIQFSLENGPLFLSNSGNAQVPGGAGDGAVPTAREDPAWEGVLHAMRPDS